MMLEELQRRNYSEITTRKYLQYVTSFARHFGKSPDQLGPNELRSYQTYLLQERKVTPGTAVNCVAALRFFFVKSLKRHQFREFLPYPRDRRRLPTVLSQEEVSQLINGAGNLFRRTLLMTLYGTGMRRAELARLKVGDVDSQRMIIRVVAGKGGKDRDLPLSPALLETLREYWRWRKPKLYMFPTRTLGRRLDQPISDKTVWIACSEAARRAGISKRVPPHTLRHSWATHLLCPRLFKDNRDICEHAPSLSLRILTPGSDTAISFLARIGEIISRPPRHFVHADQLCIPTIATSKADTKTPYERDTTL